MMEWGGGTQGSIELQEFYRLKRTDVCDSSNSKESFTTAYGTTTEPLGSIEYTSV